MTDDPERRDGLDRRVPSVESCMAEVDRRIDAKLGTLKTGLDANTEITLATNKKLDEHILRTNPIVEALDTMQVGVRVIGRIGRIGTAVAKFGLWFVAIWVFFWTIAHGESISTAITAFFRALAGTR